MAMTAWASAVSHMRLGVFIFALVLASLFDAAVFAQGFTCRRPFLVRLFLGANVRAGTRLITV